MPLPPNIPGPRFRFRPEKAAEAIDVIARAIPGATQYFVGKYLYLADKEHLLDWGRPITFDRYVAMKHGPVPSEVRNLLGTSAGVDLGIPDYRLEDAERGASALARRVRVTLEVTRRGERQRVYSLNLNAPYEYLSQSDIECLERVVSTHGKHGFGRMREMTHKDDAWAVAWNNRGKANAAEIDLALWASPEEQDAVRGHLAEYAAVAV